MSTEQLKEDQDQQKEKTTEKTEAEKQATDPQDNMEGPISSLVQAVKEEADSDETREEADKKKAENM